MKSNRYHIYVLSMVLAATAIISVVLYILPHRATSFDFSREVGRPWTHTTLIAPVELELTLSDEQAQHIRDSVEQHFMDKYFYYDPAVAEQQIKRLDSITTLTPSARQQVKAIFRQVYASRILETNTADSMRHYRITTIKLRDPANERQTNEVAATSMRSQSEAYDHIDTLLTQRGLRTALSTVDLSEFLQPNIIVDHEYNNKLLQDEQEKALNAKRKLLSEDRIQVGEAIIAFGNRVTERQDRFIQLLEDKIKAESQKHDTMWRVLGEIVVVLLFMLAFYAFVRLFRSHLYGSLRNWAFFLSIITIFVVIVLLTISFRPRYIMLIPFALVPIIVTTYYDERTSFFVHMIVVLICAIAAPDPMQLIVMQFLAGMIAVMSMQELTRRSQLVKCALWIFIAYVVSYAAMQLTMGHPLKEIDWGGYLLFFAINCVVLSFAYMGIYLVDKFFGFTSTITLEELSDIARPAFRNLSEKCPGTFQHSLQVANIAGEAAVEIGANPQLVRAGALYHDIGKSENPAFFTENQRGVNPHDALTPEQSAQIVVQHVADGLRLAAKYGLPQVIRDMIAQHHGCGTTRYFYAQACKDNNNGHTDPAPFTYPGPNPQTREAAILMMADSCEAATKSLRDPSQEAITALVEKIVNNQVAEGLLREAPITFKEVETVKRVLAERLSAIYYTRISYPEIVRPADPASGQSEQTDQTETED